MRNTFNRFMGIVATIGGLFGSGHWKIKPGKVDYAPENRPNKAQGKPSNRKPKMRGHDYTMR